MPSRARLLGAGTTPSLVRLCALLVVVALSLVLPAAASAQASGTACVWANGVGDAGIDGFGADLNAGYWVTSFLAVPGSELTLTGSYPDARYMSIGAYDSLDNSIDPHLYDAEIQPLAGTGSNPFASAPTPGATPTYQVQIVAGTGSGSSPANTLYVPANFELVWVMYRVYDPASAADPTGGAGLPQAQTSSLGGITTSTEPTCPQTTSTASLPVFTATPTATPAGEPSWSVANVTRLPDPDTGYLTAQITQSTNEIVVFRALMPTFPNTNSGQAVDTPGVDVRYWSICEYEDLLLVAAGCTADHAAVESPSGVATFVVSTPQNRPPNATAADGVNWLPWGSTTAGLIVYRQMLASFPQSVTASAGSSSLPATMGDYYPQITYCSVTTFAQSGADGCLDPSAASAGSATSPGTATGAGPATPPSSATSSAAGSTTVTTASGASDHGELSRSAIARVLSPELVPTGRASKIKELLAARGYTFTKYTLPEAGRVRLNWWYRYGKRTGQTLVATGTVTLARKLTGKLKVKLTTAGSKLLNRSTRVTLTGVASYSPTGASRVTLDRSFTVRR